MHISFQHHTIEESDFTFHYVSTGDAEKQPILFIHGVLSNWTNYKDIMEDDFMQKNYYMFSADRLGWGQSLIQGKNSETSLLAHANAIQLALKKINAQTNKKCMVVGHSFGGSIATQLCIQNPNLIKSLVTISSPFKPGLAEPHWYTKFGDLLMIKITLPKHLIRANDEALKIKHELTKLQPLLKDLNIPVTIMHGSDDKVVDYQHSNYGKAQLAHLGYKCKHITIEEGKHFILRENKNDIIQGIGQSLSKP